MRAALDLYIAGFPWIEQTGAIKLRGAFASFASPTTDFGDDNTLDVEIVDDEGTQVGTGTASTVDSLTGHVILETSITPADALDPAKVYRAHWTGTLTTVDDQTATVDVWHDAWATPSPMRIPPVSSVGLGLATPALSGQALQGQLQAAWYEVCAWVAEQRKGVLWTPSAFVPALRSLALSKVYEAKAANGSASALALANYHRTAYSNAMEAIRAGWDEDGDGKIDNVQSAVSAGGGVGG